MEGGRGVVAVITKKDWMGGVTFYPSSSCYNSYTLRCSHLPHLCLWSPLLPFHCHFINLSNQCPCQTQTMKANSRLNIWEVCQSGQRKEGALLKIDLVQCLALDIKQVRRSLHFKISLSLMVFPSCAICLKSASIPLSGFDTQQSD